MENNQNKFMKGPIIVYIVLLLCTVVFIVIFANWAANWFESSDDKLSGNLFNKAVLEDRFCLEWLKKPENAENEKQYIDQEKRYYIYECEFNDAEQSDNYVDDVFNNFITKNYTIAYFLQDGSAFNDPYNRVKISQEISDFNKKEETKSSFIIYYTPKSKETLTTLAEGLNVGCLSVIFELNYETKQNGKYTFYIKLHKTPAYNIAVDN